MALAKTTRPSVRGVVLRARLFRLLDQGRDRPVTWIQAPPGSGKTSLIASYVQTRKLRCLWYQVDEGDADVASFFYYLTQAAPRGKRPLPVLTPDQLPAMGLFAQRFFRELFSRFRPPFAIVFDSYHRLPKESPVHEGMAEALAQIPQGGRVIIASRTGPPPSLARLRASRMIHMVTSDDLRLSPRESEAIVRAAVPGRLSRDALVQMLEIAGGWTAGLVLLLEQFRARGPDFRVDRRHGAEAIFDYFASEIFKRADGQTQQFLLQTAFLPRFTTAMAERLTGLGEAERILADLYRESSFTSRFGEDPPVYQYHILFREFLLARARQTLSEECRAETWRAAAGLLEEAGQADDAVRLLTEAEDWTSLSALITRQAPAAFARGRGQTLLQWIERVPEHLRERDPWLLHWRAACRQLFDLRQSRQDSHRAFRLFRDLGNRAGAFRAWGQAVSSYLCELDDLAPLDGWVSDLEAMLAEEPAFPSREVEVAVTNSMLGALILRQPANPHLRGWAERTEALARELPGGDLHDQALLHLIAYHYWTGDMARALLLADTLGDSIRSRQGSPLVRLVVSVFITRLEWLQGRSNDLRAVRERIKAAQAWDAVPLRSLIAEAACASLSLGDRASAGEFLQQLGRVVGKAPPHDTAYYHFLVAWDAILVGDLTRALRHGEECVRLILQVGCPPVEALARGFLAQLLHESGEHDEGWASLALALDIARHSAYRVVLFPVLLTEAYLAFDHEDEERGLGALREGLALGRERGYFSTFGWRPAVLSRLCAKALEAGIEVEYVRDLIRKRGLVPEGLSAESEAWPWPVRVYALGRFDLLRDEQPVRFEGKAQRRPLGLLRALIAYGGQDVQEASLTDTLWPEAEGDAAAQALSTTIHRLRRLLRREEAILRQEGRVSLNRQVCWVDVWAFERLLIRAETVRAGGREEAWAQVLAWTRRAADLYRGPFLGSEGEAACAVPLAERLRQRWVNHLAAMARREGERGEWLRAVEWCEKGLESDPCAEVLYRGLMTAYAGLGRRSEALAIYQRCRKNLQAALEVGPSAETEEIFRRLRSA